MGKAPNGIFGPVSGKLMNVVFYVAQGQWRARSAGKRRAALTPAELINTSKMKVLMNFFKHINPFLKVGFGTDLAHSNQNYHNRATAYNKKNAVRVRDGKPELAYDLIRVSSGSGLEAEQPIVQVTGSQLEFSWQYQEERNWQAGSDQVMMMAFFPDENDAIYERAGAKRKVRQDFLSIPSYMLSKRMEIYIAFVSQDRQSVSNSLYLGRLN